MAHPNHIGRKLQRGGSMPKANNNFGKAVGVHLGKLRVKTQALRDTLTAKRMGGQK